MKKNRLYRKLFFALLITVVLTACRESDESGAAGTGVTLNIISTFGGSDGNREAYVSAINKWCEKTGSLANDSSDTSDEAFKSRVLTDFETGAEPDVLFYFNGSDVNNIIANRKLVPIEEILSVYPDYISEHDLSLIPASPYDNKKYAVPMFGMWELMFVNNNVIEKSGVNIPDENTTWDEFIEICEKIRNSGFTPIAAALDHIPHYWFEYSIFNFTGIDNHGILPKSALDETGRKWVNGLNSIKELFDKSYFPANTTFSNNDEMWHLMYDDLAAFAIDGVWKIGSIEKNCPNDIEKMTATFVPSNNEARKNTDIIAGLSTGWYITRKAWDNPEKQSLAVDFVNYMTSREIISTFPDAPSRTVTLKSGVIEPENASPLMQDCMDLIEKMTGSAQPVQDYMQQLQREMLFIDIKNIMIGKMTAREAIDNALKVETP